HWVTGLLILSLSTGERIATTPNHPFYARHKYLSAEALVEGDTLFSLDKTPIVLRGKTNKDTTVQVYNFTVSNNNNYFVGKNHLLVHNTNCLADNLINNFPNLYTKFKTLTDAQKDKFLEDFADAEDAILGVLNQGKAFEAWEVLQTRSELRKDIAYLTKISGMLTNPKIQKVFGSGLSDDLAKMATINGNVSFWGKRGLDYHLNLLEETVNKFADLPGAKGIRDGVTNSASGMQEGTWHSLRQMNTLDPSKVKQMDLKFDGGDLSCKNCKFDIEMHEVTPADDNWIRFYEYKSYKNPAEIDIEQFKNYIGSITNLKQLRYVFEESKLTASGISAKDGMKVFFVKYYDTIWTTGQPKGL
ncbi:MAG: polymorphic toxin-type HINT domain-containing protein, partial [Flectobacillus sp.]|uniref:polymorphic toxin-type HINT domain-containing protein n=1 Tax=Flectobacillus sp. TaxID=50419 RepID=UPI003B9DB685